MHDAASDCDNNNDLLKRVEALEIATKFDATREEIRRIQMQHLEQLRSIRVALVQSSEQGSTLSSTTTMHISNKEMEALTAENAALKLKTDKQAYRIQHLVATVEDLLTKTTTTTA